MAMLGPHLWRGVFDLFGGSDKMTLRRPKRPKRAKRLDGRCVGFVIISGMVHGAR